MQKEEFDEQINWLPFAHEEASSIDCSCCLPSLLDPIEASTTLPEGVTLKGS